MMKMTMTDAEPAALVPDARPVVIRNHGPGKFNGLHPHVVAGHNPGPFTLYEGSVGLHMRHATCTPDQQVMFRPDRTGIHAGESYWIDVDGVSVIDQGGCLRRNQQGTGRSDLKNSAPDKLQPKG